MLKLGHDTLLLWTCACAAALVTACGDDDDDFVAADTGGTGTTTGVDTGVGDTATTTEGIAGESQLRIVHASPEAPEVDVYLAGQDTPVFAALAYQETSPAITLEPGDYTFELRPAGAASTDAPLLVSEPITLDDRRDVLGVIAGLPEDEGDDMLRIIAVVDDLDDDPDDDPDDAEIRVVHASTDAETIAIDLLDDGTSEIENLAPYTVSDDLDVPAGQEAQVAILSGGETLTTLTVPALEPDSEVTLIATGRIGDAPRADTAFGILAVGPEGTLAFVRQNPVLYFLHGSSDAPAIDVCAGTEVLIDDLAFGSLDLARIPAGTVDLQIVPSDAMCEATSAIAPLSIEAVAGEGYLNIVAGELEPEGGEPALQLQTYLEQFPLEATDSAVLSLIHAASAPTVDVGLVVGGMMPGDTLLVQGLSFGNQSEVLTVPPGTYEVGLAAAGQEPPLTPIAAFEVAVPAGFRGWAIAIGDISPEGMEEAFRLLAIDTATQPWPLVALPDQTSD